VESLVCRPVDTSHAGLPEDLVHDLGITPDLVRVSVGVEGVNDLIDDFTRAFVHATRRDVERQTVAPASFGGTA
jgi:cystathionine beta-lyase/cystathionine gamma-synthase